MHMKRTDGRNFRLGSRIVMLTVQLFLCSILIYKAVKTWQVEPDMKTAPVNIDILCMLIASIFSLSLLRSRRESPTLSTFLWIIFFDVMHLFSDGIFVFTDGKPEFRMWTILGSAIYLICPLVMTSLYWKMLDYWISRSDRYYKWADKAIKFIAGAGILLALGNTPFNYYSGVNEAGYYYRGELYILTIIIPVVMVALCIIRIFRCNIPMFERLVLLSYPAPPIIAAFAQHIFDTSVFLTAVTFLSIVMVYTNVYLIRETELAEMENRLTVSKLYSLQMQINPHMLFNTMSSIAGMCDIDPEKSQEMIFKLSDYLRDNFTDIYKPTMISLREELEHLDHYIAIEIMRFPNITIIKDIKCFDFTLPRMSLQPLVENAIKHGICKNRRAKGTLTIRSYETEEAWFVSIEDDGAGFSGPALSADRDEHHGIYNVRTRLSILCGGSLEVVGTPGEGAVSTIKIPKNKDEKEERM